MLSAPTRSDSALSTFNSSPKESRHEDSPRDSKRVFERFVVARGDAVDEAEGDGRGDDAKAAAAGALQLAAALVALDEQTLHASCGFELQHFVGERRAMPLRNILVNSVSAGGGIVCAVVSR